MCRRIAFHQIPHSDCGSSRSGMVASMVQVGSGHPIGTIDSQFVNHVWAHDPDATRRAALRYSGTARWTHRRANTKTGRDGPDRVEDLMGKQRREQSQDSIFVDNPFVDGFLEWMGSREAAYPVDSGLSRCSMLSNRIGAVARVGTDGEGAVACRIQEVVFR